ncbi:MAG: NAD(P)H-hydrate dehydratase [Clostridia bacterium]|nr:NAD(P)H-hydrate dehydratase [Clostridia bacterium]
MLFLSEKMIREAELKAMENVSEMNLIDRAASTLFSHLKNFSSVRIYCGKGNNGSDGYATAILLSKKGVKVEIVAVYEPERDACIELYNRALREGITIKNEVDFPTESFDAVLDSIFGIGLSGVISGNAQKAIEIINAEGGYVVSCDVPSGMEADTGKALGECVRADKTVTFTAPKRGMLSNESVDYCGEIVIADVGIPIDYSAVSDSGCVPITDLLVKTMLPERKRLSHKGTFGTAVIVAGSSQMAGAAAMAALAAYKSGCGLVKIIAPESISSVLNILVKEAIVIKAPEKDGVIAPQLTEDMREALSRAQAVLVGCGLGKGDHSILISNIINATNAPIIIDADGINALRGNLHIIKNQNVILTPHPLEFSRISGIEVREIERHRVQYAANFASEYSVSLLLKGARSIVAYGGSNKYVSLIATSALSKAGSGDILSGIMVSFASQGLSLTDSGAAACHVHAKAGLIAEKTIGVYGTTCDDLINNIPLAIKEILN